MPQGVRKPAASDVLSRSPQVLRVTQSWSMETLCNPLISMLAKMFQLWRAQVVGRKVLLGSYVHKYMFRHLNAYHAEQRVSEAGPYKMTSSLCRYLLGGNISAKVRSYIVYGQRERSGLSLGLQESRTVTTHT